MDIQYLKSLDWLGLILIQVITPFVPFAFPIRFTITAYMATQHNWMLVVIVANSVGTLSLMLQYFLFQRIGAERWLQKAEQVRVVEKISTALDTRMFMTLILLIASPVLETLLPLAASAKRYSIWKFAAAMFIGRLAHTIPMTLSGIGFTWLWHQLH